MTRRVHVTDHALIRYLERALGVDTEGLRRRIARAARPGAEKGADAIIVDGVRFCLSDHTVTTVTGPAGRKCKRGLRAKSRQKARKR